MRHRIQEQLDKLKISLLFSVFFFMGINFFSLLFASNETLPEQKQATLAQFGQLPLTFEKNVGQVESKVAYLSRGKEADVYFTPQEMVFVLKKRSEDKQMVFYPIQMAFKGTSENSMVKALNELEGKSNYFIGNDPSKWKTSVPHYEQVKYEGIYPGVDLVFYGNPYQLEYDFILAPGANPKVIRMTFEGTQDLSIDSEGSLSLILSDGETLKMTSPSLYQQKGENRIAIEGKFVQLASNEVGFVVGEYDQSEKLVIDPMLVYSTYLGGSGDDEGFGITVDSVGNAYVTGATNSPNFPTQNALQPSLGGPGSVNAFVTKLNTTGAALVYSTYLGGSGNDQGVGIAVDTAANAYVIGSTTSTDFPTTGSAFQTAFRGGGVDAFVTKLNATGAALMYSTYLGGTGSDVGHGIAVDSLGDAYVTGGTSSTDFPTTGSAFQTAFGGVVDAFVTKLNTTGTALVYSTYLGGNQTDQGNGIAIDSTGNAYVTGITNSPNFPTQNALQPSLGGPGSNAFVTKLNTLGTALVYSTYLGGNQDDVGNGIAVDSTGNAYVVGFTDSMNFPTTGGAFQTGYGGGFNDAFVTKLNATGAALAYSTYLGGTGDDEGFGIAVDTAGNAYVTGRTNSTDFPITADAFQSANAGIVDAFVTKLNAMGTALVYSTYLGGSDFDEGNGIAVDTIGNAYVVGSTRSTNFPTTGGAFQTTYGGGLSDAFISKFSTRQASTVTLQVSPNPAAFGQPVTLTATVTPSSATGTVSFFDGGVLIGTSPVVNGVAQLVVSNFSVGTHILTAIYSGDVENLPATSNAVALIVVPRTTTVTLQVSPNPAAFGQPVTLTATVSPSSATGTVSFFDGGVLIGTSPVVNGVAQLVVSNFSVGTHILTAVYSGDAENLPATSSPVTLIVITAQPPIRLKAFQVANKFATQTDRINILTWKAPQGGTSIVAYEIYRDPQLRHLIARISSQAHLRFVDHNRKPGKIYTYFIVSVDQFGNRSVPAKITVKEST